MSQIKKKIDVLRAVWIGVGISLAAAVLQNSISGDYDKLTNLPYLGGAALGGAFFGWIIAKGINMGRRDGP